MLTQKTVADSLHVRQNTYSQYETGQRQIPIDNLIALADFYKVSVDYLLGLTDRPESVSAAELVPGFDWARVPAGPVDISGVF